MKMTLEINGIEQDVTVNVLSYTSPQPGFSWYPENRSEEDLAEVEFQVYLYGVDVTDELSDRDYERIAIQLIDMIGGL